MLGYKSPTTLKRQEFKPAIGVYEDGSPIILPTEMPHFLVSGRTGSGKSSFIAATIAALSHTQSKLIGVDLKAGLELALYEPHLTELAASHSEALEALRNAETLMLERLQTLKATRRRKWEGSDRVVVIIDELAETLALDFSLEPKEAKEQQREILGIITRIARIGRAPGVSLVCATQLPRYDIVPTELRSNLQARICCQIENREGLSIALGGWAEGYSPNDIPPYPGCALIAGLDANNQRPKAGRAYYSADSP